MKYMSHISSPKGRVKCLEVEGSAVVDWHTGDVLRDWVSKHSVLEDTEDNCIAYRGIRDSLGIGLDPSTCGYVAITHNKKTALLHRYVDWACTRMGEKPEPMKGSDVVYWPLYRERVLHGSEYLDIRITCKRMAIFGQKGSIVSFKPNYQSNEYFYTLYDFLIYMARELNLNLMQYSHIRFSDEDLEKWYCVVEFLDNPEARRFKTKMWMDACARPKK